MLESTLYKSMSYYLNVVLIIIIFILLVMVRLAKSKKAGSQLKSLGEWEKIKDYGEKINEKTRNKKN